MRTWAAWAIGAALVAAAWGVAAITPGDDASQSPFPVDAEVGERAVGRNIALTVLDVQRAETLRAGAWAADGNWVIIDLDVEAVVSEFGSLLQLATLEVDGRTFGASERPDSLLRSALSVGIPRSGSLAFELADEVTGGTAVLRLGEAIDPRLDSIILLEIDLAEIPMEREVTMEPTVWSTR